MKQIVIHITSACTALAFCLLTISACNSTTGSEKEAALAEKEVKTAALVKKKHPTPIRTISGNINKDFPFEITVKNSEGVEINSKQLFANKKKATVLLFWLTTCYPCRLELAAIKEKFPKWKEEVDFDLFAISTDFEKNHSAFYKRVEAANWPFEAYLDASRSFWKVMPGELNGLPQVFVYDENGEIAFHKRKYKPGDEDALFEAIKALY